MKTDTAVSTADNTFAKYLSSTDLVSFSIDEELKGTEADFIVYDLSALRFMNSIQIASLIELQQAFARNDQTMVISGLGDELVRIFEILRLHMVFDIYPTVDSALTNWQLDDKLCVM